MVPESRITACNDAEVDPDGEFVLHWMIGTRRIDWNFAFDRALEWARELELPLVVLEALRSEYPWASDRIHRFVIDGMADNAERLADAPVTYHPYVEPEHDAGSGLLEALARRAAVVVTDDYPAFFLPEMVAAAGRKLDVRLEKVDSNGVYPMRLAEKAYSRAYLFRKHLQKVLRPHLGASPTPDPVRSLELPTFDLPAEIRERWPAATDEMLTGGADVLADLPIDHDVPVVEEWPGGRNAGLDALERFLDGPIDDYADGRNHPDDDASSHLSPYLHFGYVSPHEVFDRIARREDWSADDLSDSTKGSREGWWGMSEGAEAYLDELITWRELGFNMCVVRPDDYHRYETLPDWAQKTLQEHADDPREYVYTLDEFERADTHDELWNAAQRQLRVEGRIHNYLRMLWGKKILHWSESPHVALEIMIELNNKYALDGRDPNSYSGIFWVLGRYDRAWGPERPIFGKVRYMTCKSARKKLRLSGYLERWAEAEAE